MKKQQVKKRPHLVVVKGVRFSQSSGFFLRSLSIGQMSASEIEAARRVIRRKIRKQGSLFIRAFGFLPLVRKPSEVRMGKGKGNRLRKYVYPIRPGQIICELRGVSYTVALSALRSGSRKFSVKTGIFCLINK